MDGKGEEGFENKKEINKMKLVYQKEIDEMKNDNKKEFFLKKKERHTKYMNVS